jgi:hypothetical protein
MSVVYLHGLLEKERQTEIQRGRKEESLERERKRYRGSEEGRERKEEERKEKKKCVLFSNNFVCLKWKNSFLEIPLYTLL